MLFRKFDHVLLWGLLTPLLLVAGIGNWLAVQAHAPLSGLALLDFSRLHLGYYGAALLWSIFLLCGSSFRWGWRLVVLLAVFYFIGADIAYSASIYFTGALAPFDVAYYMGKAIDSLKLSIQMTEWVTLAFIPLFMLALVMIKWVKVRLVLSINQKKIGLSAALVLLAFTLIPPLAPGLELNTARPSYAYQIVEFLQPHHWIGQVEAKEHPAPAGPSILRAAEKPRNVVIIALESVGAVSTSLHNPSIPGVTPFLESLAPTSWVPQGYTVTPHTSKAMVAINCGQQPYPRHPIFESTYGVNAPCLADVLKTQGYSTVFFQSPTEHFENRRGLVKNLGFEEFYSGEKMDSSGFQLASYFGFEDNIMLQPSREWIKKQNKPFFAFYLTGATHHPYWVPDRYGFHEYVKNDVEQNRYLNAVHYLDEFTRELITQYKEAGLYENTLFIVVGDHGESLGQHSRLQHNASLYEEVMQVPLLFHAPGMTLKGSSMASQLDILPSVLSLLGFQWQGELEGMALVNTGQQRKEVIAGCWYDNWCLASMDGRYKYIFNFNQKQEELYDLQADPAEQNNIASQYPERTEQLRQQLLEHHRAQLSRWHGFLSQKDPDYWDNRAATLGEPTRLLKLSQSDPRFKLLTAH